MIAFLGNDAIECDPAERESHLRDKVPDLLLHDERVVLAFKDRGGKGRDSSSFTTKRFLIKDKKGLGKKTEYKSIPYGAIRGYAVETAGSLDSDVELTMYVAGVGKIKIDFVAGKVDIFKIKRFLNEMVLVGDRAGKDAGEVIATTSVPESEGKTNIFDLLGNNASQIDSKTVEATLKSDPMILLPDETVELAFKCGRDSFLLTSKRILKIDVQGISGKRVEYFTILWPTIKGFSIETAGNILDRDAELTLFTNLPDNPSITEGLPRKSRTRIGIDFRKGEADIFAVQKYFSNKLLGTDTVDPSGSAVSMEGQEDTGSGNPFSWIGDDSRMIDAEVVDAQYHVNPPILQNCEKVEMAFKGRRDMMLFTSKRLIFVDIQGFMGLGKKVEYTSLPWDTVKAFGVKSAGSFLDKDSELMIWPDFDDAFYPPKVNQDDAPPPPIPRKTYIEIDFQKDKVDLMAIHRFLSERCLRVEGGQIDDDGYYVPNKRPFDMPVSPDIMAPTNPGALDSVLGWLGDDAHAIDPAELDVQLHGDARILQVDEKVVLAYKAGRDTLALTNKRIFVIDVQGFTGKRIAYVSYPYTSIRAFAVESAGSWDTDGELKVWLQTHWMGGSPGNKLKQDLRKSKADIIAIQTYISQQVIGSQDGSPVIPSDASSVEGGTVNTFLSFLSDNGVATDPTKVEQQLKTSPQILQVDEGVDAVYKIGRDLCVYTTKRVLLIDKQGITGKRVEYRSIPLRYALAYKIETSGHLMSEPKIRIYMEGAPDVKQDLAKGSSDVWGVNKILANHILEK